MREIKNIDFVPEGSRLTFLRLTDKKSGSNTFAIYKCICGKEKEIRTSHAKAGQTISCGCYVGDAMRNKVMTNEERVNRSLCQVTHGLSKHPLYKVYYNIIRRCEDEKSEAFKYYGLRGVSMCAEWRNNFKAFYDWAISKGWERGMQIDKDIIPKKLGLPALIYSPEMCSVVSQKENINAIASNVNIEYMGRTQTLAQWAEELRFNYAMVWARLNRGFDFELAINRPKRNIVETASLNKKIILNTETGIFYFGAKEAADSAALNFGTLHQKLVGNRRNNTPFIYV